MAAYNFIMFIKIIHLKHKSTVFQHWDKCVPNLIGVLVSYSQFSAIIRKPNKFLRILNNFGTPFSQCTYGYLRARQLFSLKVKRWFVRNEKKRVLYKAYRIWLLHSTFYTIIIIVQLLDTILFSSMFCRLFSSRFYQKSFETSVQGLILYFRTISLITLHFSVTGVCTKLRGCFVLIRYIAKVYFNDFVLLH